MEERLYSVSTCEPSENLLLEVSRLFNTYWSLYLSLDETYSQPCGRSGEQKRLSSVRPPLLRACNGILADEEENYPGSDLYVDFAEKRQTAHLSCLSTKERLREMMKAKNYCAVDTMFPFVVALADRSLAVVGRYALTGKLVLYTDVVKKGF